MAERAYKTTVDNIPVTVRYIKPKDVQAREAAVREIFARVVARQEKTADV